MAHRDSTDKPPPGPERLRNGGPLLGKPDGLLPCLYIAQQGIRAWELRSFAGARAPGLFALGEPASRAPGGTTLKAGLVLPVSLCRDERARSALARLPDFLTELRAAPLAEQRRRLRARLDATFQGDLVVQERESFEGCFALRPSPGLFRRLHQSFDFVTEVRDDPAGTVQVSRAEPFGWRSYGELMEWYHRLWTPDAQGRWWALTPLFLWGGIGALKVSHSEGRSESRARAGLHTPAEEPTRWFRLRADLPDARLTVRLQMEEHGSARLHLSLGEATATVLLSEVFDPFPTLVAFGREVDEGDLPVQVEVDEEGRVACLTALRTDDPGRILLRVTRRFPDTLLLEGVVSRAELAGALRGELRRFFREEFDPRGWGLREPERAEDGDDLPVREWVLGHPWLGEG